VDLLEALRPLEDMFLRHGGPAPAVGLTRSVDHVDRFREALARSLEPLAGSRNKEIHADAELSLLSVNQHFNDRLLQLEPFGEGNRSPMFSIRNAEAKRVRRNKWVRIRQGRSSVEALCWDIPVTEHMKGDFLVEFYGKIRILRAFTPSGA